MTQKISVQSRRFRIEGEIDQQVLNLHMTLPSEVLPLNDLQAEMVERFIQAKLALLVKQPASAALVEGILQGSIDEIVEMLEVE